MSMISKIASRLLRRVWSGEAVDKYIGAIKDAYLAHAPDGTLRVNAASGGVVTALLIHMLDGGTIKGALVCRSTVRNGKVRAEFFIARNSGDLLKSQGSKYVPVHFSHEALPLIEAFDGPLAVVGLPCDIAVMRHRMEKDAKLNEKVRCLIAIVCGHNSEEPLVDQVVQKLEREAGSKISDYRFRRGLWRGKLNATFENGGEVAHPFSSRFGLYQNLYFWSEKKCFQCHDHYGYDADISTGDVWSMELKDKPIKYSGVLTRNDRGHELFAGAVDAGAIQTKPISPELILEGQARTGPFHYNLTARMGAARLYGLKLKDTVFEPVRWNDRLAAHIALFNWRWSRNARLSPLIFRLPRPLLKLYLYFFKFLESL